MKNFGYIITKKSVVITLKGKQHTFSKGSEKYEKVISLIKGQKIEELESFLAPGKVLVNYSGGKFESKNGEVYLVGDEEPLVSALAKKVLAFAKEDLPIQPLLEFWKNLKSNPSQTSKEELYIFLEANHHPITMDGCFIAYKKVNKVNKERNKLVDNYTKTIDNSVGKIVEVDRASVDPDRNRTCSHGLHVASYDYAKGYSGDTLIAVKVNPTHVVSVPPDYNNQKMRVCQYEVLDIFNDSELSGQIVITDPKELDNVAMQEKTTVSSTKLHIKGMPKKEIDFRVMTGKEIIDFVNKETKIRITVSLKNKQSIIKQAKRVLEERGYTVLS